MLGDVVSAGGDGNDWFNSAGKMVWGKTTGPAVTTRPSYVMAMEYRQSTSYEAGVISRSITPDSSIQPCRNIFRQDLHGKHYSKPLKPPHELGRFSFVVSQQSVESITRPSPSRGSFLPNMGERQKTPNLGFLPFPWEFGEGPGVGKLFPEKMTHTSWL